MLAVEMSRTCCGDEELSPVAVCSSVRHRHEALARVLDLEALVLEPSSIDRLSPSSIALGEVSSLNHEARDDAMKLGSLVGESRVGRLRSFVLLGVNLDLASTEGSEVVGSAGASLAVQPDDDPTNRLPIDLNVEEALLCHRHVRRDVLLLQQEVPLLSLRLLQLQGHVPPELVVHLDLPQALVHLHQPPELVFDKRLLPFEAQLQHRRCELVVDVLGLDGLVDGHSHHNVTPVVLVPIRQASSSQTQSLWDCCL
mmetsp:Transcript_32752/g.103633  ORF Transcript_32752/g.103633 Transcript_32752/m.103633 type:complete len:255 (+) Transcript_32752:188-952(+)